MTPVHISDISIVASRIHDPPASNNITATFAAVVLLDNIHRVHGESSITINELIAAILNCKEVFYVWTHP